MLYVRAPEVPIKDYSFLPARRWDVGGRGWPKGRLSCDGRSGINSVCRWRLLRRRRCRHCAPLCQPRAEILRHGFSPLPRRITITLPLPLPVCEATNPASDRNKPARSRVRTTIIRTIYVRYLYFNSSAPRRYSRPFFCYPLSTSVKRHHFHNTHTHTHILLILYT